jgi:hypothetical protein
MFCNQCHKEILLNWISCRYCNTEHVKILNCIECFTKIHINTCEDDDGWIFFYRYPKEELKKLFKDFSGEYLKFSQIGKKNKFQFLSNDIKNSNEESIENKIEKGIL